MGGFAGASSCVGFVGPGSHFDKSLCATAEHVGEQKAGAGNCLASLGRGGSLGHCGGEGISCGSGAVAQPCSSSAIGSSQRRVFFHANTFGISNLLHTVSGSGFFAACVLKSLE